MQLMQTSTEVPPRTTRNCCSKSAVPLVLKSFLLKPRQNLTWISNYFGEVYLLIDMGKSRSWKPGWRNSNVSFAPPKRREGTHHMILINTRIVSRGNGNITTSCRSWNHLLMITCLMHRNSLSELIEGMSVV